jgi:hypothetical protein
MIIWSGLGFMPVVFYVASLFCFNTDSDRGLAYSFFLAGVASSALGWYLRSRPARIVIDKKTGQEIALRRSHSLFFIPMVYWGLIFAAMGIYFLIRSVMKH